MSDRSKIEWCDTTWNPITGCTKISQGCKNCYAAELHNRRHAAYLRGAKLPQQYAQPFETVQLHPDRLEMPLHWRKLRRIFVNSTSDLFHEDVPDEFIGAIFNRMEIFNQHIYMVLTKRPDRMSEFCREFGIESRQNIWLGVSVENQAAADERIPLLLQTPAAVRFISCEPLLGPVKLFGFGSPTWGKLPPSRWLHWVIVGGESGPGARPMHPDWARSLLDQCSGVVPFFFKQWGEWHPSAAQYDDDDFMDKLDFGSHCICLGNRGTKFREEWGDREEYWCGYQPDPAENPWFMERVGKTRAGRLLDGREWNEYPNGGKE